MSRSESPYAPRWSAVPWLSDSDLDEGERAIWDVELQQGVDKRSCWQVPLYEPHKSTCGYLVMHAVKGNGNDGGDISLAISDTPRYDVYAKESFEAVPQQSNPQRKRYLFRSKWESKG